MDGTALQLLVNRGYAICGGKIGLPFAQYRPLDVMNPLANLLGTVPASFNATDMTYKKPNSYGKPVWYALVDAATTLNGDYFIGNGYTFFIASLQPLLPIQAVNCDHVVTIYRPQQQTGVGALGYGGNTRENQTAIAANYPAAIIINTKAETGIVKLPGDVRAAWWNLYIPALPGGVLIKNYDVVIDENGNRYAISAAELTEMGWRCTMSEAET